MIAGASPGMRKSIIAPVTRACHVAGVLLDHGGQPILLLELLAAGLLAVEDAGADDRPVVVEPGIEQVVEIDRLMRAVEVADAEMQDAGLERGAIVFRAATFGGAWRGWRRRVLRSCIAFSRRSSRPEQSSPRGWVIGEKSVLPLNSSSCRRRHCRSGRRCSRSPALARNTAMPVRSCRGAHAAVGHRLADQPLLLARGRFSYLANSAST